MPIGVFALAGIFYVKIFANMDIICYFCCVNNNTNVMSSINQLVSEIAHSVQEADSVPARRAIKLGLVHARNELIRKTYANHNYVDKVLKQRFRISLTTVNDGDLIFVQDTAGDTKGLTQIRRTVSKIPIPTRLINNLPIHSVRTVGVHNPINIAYIGEGAAKYYTHLPGMTNVASYDYINGYLYFNNLDPSITQVVVEGVFEYPVEYNITTTTDSSGKITAVTESIDKIDDDNELFLPEDLVGAAIKMVLETFNPKFVRDGNEIPTAELVK